MAENTSSASFELKSAPNAKNLKREMSRETLRSKKVQISERSPRCPRNALLHGNQVAKSPSARSTKARGEASSNVLYTITPNFKPLPTGSQKYPDASRLP